MEYFVLPGPWVSILIGGGFVWGKIRPIKSTSQIPSRARWITVSRNLKEEAKDEPVSGVGYEIIDLLTKNNRGVQNWVGWGYYYYTTTLGRAANLLKLKFTCGFLHVQWFIHTKRG